jgi:hypothetical protein
MSAITGGDILCSFKTSGEPEMELLAFSLEARKLLKSDGNFIGFIPISVFHAVSESVFQEIVFDTLTPVSDELSDRLKLEVRDSEFFEIAIRI